MFKIRVYRRGKAQPGIGLFLRIRVLRERMGLTMAYDEKTKGIQRPHNVIMEGRSHLSISGVEEVDSFDEHEIVMFTTKGNLIIRGSSLHIDKLSLDNGELTVDGLVTDLSYEEVAKSGSLWSRLFK